MSRPTWRQWLVMIVFGTVPMHGCNHAEHCCGCGSTLRAPGSIAMLPAPAPEAAPLPNPEPGNAQATILPADAAVQDAAKKPEAPLGIVAAPIVADANPGSRTGTIVLSAEDAEAMGVKPGYTPGAIILPPQ
jgi:hypothetical protein